jgi:secreted trypsin-like serine protease
MKHGLFFLLLLITQSAFALYGDKVVPASEPFVVSLHLRDADNADRDYFCQGVLVASNKVLTAGHCIDAMGGDVYEMSHALIYRPELVWVKVGNKLHRAKSVTLAPNYFEGNGYDAEDLAMIELVQPTTVLPIKIASKNDLVNNQKLTLIAREKKVESSLLFARSYGTVAALFLNKTSGACQGDSGGAIVLKKNGQQLLAGILMYNGEGPCDRKSGYGYFPRLRF